MENLESLLNKIDVNKLPKHVAIIMDATATSLCMDNNIPLVVFGIDDPDNIFDVAVGKNIGTVVRGQDNGWFIKKIWR